MKLHKIELTGYCAKSPEWPALYLGTAGSYGNEQLAVTLGKGWEGLTVTATFQPTGVTVLVPADGTIDVPWEATETALDAAKGRIVFEGVTDGRVLISTDIPYAVGSHSDTEGSNSQPPTPSEWEQFVGEVKGDANRAEQAAKDAEAALQDVKDAGAQAVTDIGGAKDSALDAIAKAGEEAAGSITADVQAAKDAAAAAEQSAKDAAAELPKVQQAGQTVTGQITQTGATQVGAVQSAGTTQVGLVNSAGQQQAENIAQAGSQQVQAVQTAGTASVSTVNDARDEAVEEIETANAHAPQINPTTGYWRTWDAETGQYVDTTTKAQGETGATPQLTIGTVTTLEPDEDATVAITGTAEAPVLNFGIPKGEPGEGSTGGSDLPATTAADRGKAPTVNAAGTGYELTGPYAPLSAAIIETAKGNPAVCEDSVEWGLQGMRVYGKSTQVTTTGVQKISFPLWNEAVTINGVTLTPTDSGFTVSGMASETADFVSDNSFSLEENDYILSSCGIRVADVDRMCVYASTGEPYCDIESDNKVSVVSHVPGGNYYILYRVIAGQTVNKEYSHIMLNTGFTALPFEPYTGGKPSPSPEYPQEIHSAGDEGSVSITLSDSGEQSQTISFDTPNGLPGIPVDSGGNFVDATGQEWICNYRDWARGVDVKCVETIAGSEIPFIYIGQAGGSWLTTGDTIPFYVNYSQVSKPKSIANYGFCTYFTYNGGIASNDNEGFFVQAGRSYFAFRLLKSRLVEYGYDDSDQIGTGPSAFLAWLNAHSDLQIFYAVSSTETPIPSDELAAYRALHAYDGTTVITPDDALAEVEADYIVRPKAYIEKKLTAIEQKLQEVAAAQIDTQTGG